MLNTLLIAIVAVSAVWVYLDATRHRIGKIPGAKGMLNMSAGAWGAVTLGLWIIGFPAYLVARKGLIAKAQENPVEVSGRTVKAIILAALGGLWLLASAASVVSTLNTNGGTADSASEGNGSGWLDKVTSAISSSGWELKKANSGIDGEVLTATRTYPFEASNASFVIEISCKSQSKKSSMTLQSFVGSMESPTEQSAFTAVHLQNGSMPVARVKFKDGNVFNTPLYTYFAIAEYANKADFIAASMLGDAIPMWLEIGNGIGTFELEIDRSGEVEQVLAACGQDEASLAKAEAQRARAGQESQASELETPAPALADTTVASDDDLDADDETSRSQYCTNIYRNASANETTSEDVREYRHSCPEFDLPLAWQDAGIEDEPRGEESSNEVIRMASAAADGRSEVRRAALGDNGTEPRKYRPSFDCAKASTFVEREICADEILSDQDREMAEKYTALSRAGVDRNNLKATQRLWTNTRNTCTDKACLALAYMNRMRELDAYAKSQQ